MLNSRIPLFPLAFALLTLACQGTESGPSAFEDEGWSGRDGMNSRSLRCTFYRRSPGTQSGMAYRRIHFPPSFLANMQIARSRNVSRA